MNYLVVEGYRDAAEQFSTESGLAPTVDLQSIQERMDIRQAIQSGDVDTAIDLVNDLNPEVKYTELIRGINVLNLFTRYLIPTHTCFFTFNNNG